MAHRDGPDDQHLNSLGPPPGCVQTLMAGLLTCGSSLSVPSQTVWYSGLTGRSSLTVAGAVADLVPVGDTAPCSLFIPTTLCVAGNHRVYLSRCGRFCQPGRGLGQGRDTRRPL